jgi:hypothetical protein
VALTVPSEREWPRLSRSRDRYEKRPTRIDTTVIDVEARSANADEFIGTGFAWE